MNTRNTYSVSDLIDRSRLSRFQMLVLLLCAAVAAADGFDTGLMGYVAPSLGSEWGLQRQQLIAAFGAGLVGMMVGNLIFGLLADKFGRRSIMIASVMVFATGSILSGLASNIEQIVALRVLTGFGLGGAMPICLTLTSEYSPARLRMILVTLSWMGFTAGLALGGVVAAWLIPAFGWRSLFFLGGILPLLLGFLLWRLLPESLAFLALQPERRGELLATLNRICASPELSDELEVKASRTVLRARSSPISDLFAAQFRVVTPLLWITFFCSLFVFYLLANWLPTLLKGADFSIADASRINAMLPLGGTLGSLVLALAMTRAAPSAVLATAYLLSSVALAAAGYWLHEFWAVMTLVFAAGFLWVGGQNGINLLAASLYPTRIRATGVGWALGVGRAGAVIGSISGAALFAFTGSTQRFLMVAAVPLAVGGLSQLVMQLQRDRTHRLGSLRTAESTTQRS